MNDYREYLWRRIEPLLEGFLQQAVASDPSLIVVTGKSSNEAFLLRGYACLRKSRDGGEIAITVDAKSISGAVELAYDVCLEGGEVLVPGAEASLSFSSLLSEGSDEFSKWLGEFQNYLVAVQGQVVSRASRLK